jgi:hypothetical protein
MLTVEVSMKKTACFALIPRLLPEGEGAKTMYIKCLRSPLPLGEGWVRASVEAKFYAGRRILSTLQ